jgi:hypothetical protein
MNINAQRREYQVKLENWIQCSCGIPLTQKLPCAHAMRIIRQKNMNIARYCCWTWTKEAYMQAYKALVVSYPPVIAEELIVDDTKLPVLGQKRGRPRTRRIESQQALQSLE